MRTRLWSLGKPSRPAVEAFLARQERLPFSYKEVGATRRELPPAYDHDHNRIRLGEGRAVFEAACAALRRWEQFPGPWIRIEPAETPLQEGNVVAMLTRVFGLWWLNASRVVYLFNEAQPIRRFGFAYGTLPGHVESGEERFSVELHPDDSVWYDIRAFSRPRHWLVRSGYRLTRRLQRRFVMQSQAAMRRLSSNPAESVGAAPEGGTQRRL